MSTDHSSTRAAPPAIEFVNQAHGFLGYAYGLQQPALMFSVRIQLPDASRLIASDEIF